MVIPTLVVRRVCHAIFKFVDSEAGNVVDQFLCQEDRSFPLLARNYFWVTSAKTTSEERSLHGILRP